MFCNDRDLYYQMLGKADTGTSEGLEEWCIYVMRGMLVELRKVDRLTDRKYLIDRILTPALHHAHSRKLITPVEEQVLLRSARMGTVKASDLEPEMSGSQRSYMIKTLVKRRMLAPIYAGARQYTVGFGNSYLIRGVIRALTVERFIPDALAR